MPRPPKSKALDRLQKVLNEIPELKKLSTDSPEFNRWHRNTRVAVEFAFGEDGPHVSEFTAISFYPRSRGLQMFFDEDGPSLNELGYERQQCFVQGLESTDSLLKSMIEEIVEIWGDGNQAQISSSPQEDKRITTRKVFVVHGRDLGTRDSVARFLKTLKLQPVILGEQADRGQTIIEKFEQHAQEVRFAVVLLTPDDEGRIRCEESDLKPRARQNVIFELGYFARSLGRNRVCALTKAGLEIPSDYDGVVYIPRDDSGGWKMRLIKELKAAEFDVDANLAY